MSGIESHTKESITGPYGTYDHNTNQFILRI